MDKTLVILLGLLLCMGTCFNIRHAARDVFSTSEKRPIMNNYATSTGVIPITNKNGVFSIQVDLIDYSSHANDMKYGPATVDMLIHLNNAFTVFTKGCLDFADYDGNNRCSVIDCGDSSGGYNNLKFPFFALSGNTINTQAYIDYSHWSLKAPRYVTSSCTSSHSSFGSGTVGSIGLGFNYNNFVNQQGRFSIYISPDGSGGDLIFSASEKYMESTNPVGTMTCSPANWQMTEGYIYINDNSLDTNILTGIFDINFNTIGLPPNSYNGFRAAIDPFLQNCQGFNLITCFNTTAIDKFPDLLLNFDGGAFYIPAEIYLKPVPDQSNRVTIQVTSISSSAIGASYITSAFDNSYIIFGRNVLAYYYTVFDSLDSVITFYKARSDHTSPSQDPTNSPSTDNSNTGNNPTSNDASTSDPTSESEETTEPAEQLPPGYFNNLGSANVPVTIIVVLFICCLIFYQCYLSPAAVKRREENANNTNGSDGINLTEANSFSKLKGYFKK